MKLRHFTLTLLLAASSLHAATYYVAPPASGGSDSNPGTLASPYATIQRAANVAAAGDTVFIRTGTYRETITPANSGTTGARITYQNYNNEVVTISGADVISSGSWSLDSGNIYKAPLASGFFTSTMNQATQVFVDGKMVTLAKWPNVTTKTNAYPSGIAPPVDISHPAKSVTTAFVSKTRDNSANLTTGVVTDTSLPPKPAGFYDGAEIYFQPNNGGWSWIFSGAVTNVPANGNQITFTSRSNSGKDFSQTIYDHASRYYLFNKKDFLDTPGEWWHDRANGQLYLWMPASASSSSVVEVKKRDFAFNLTNRSHITIQGIRLFASSITTDSGSGGSALGHDASGNIIYPWRGAGYLAPSTGIIIDGIHAQYLNHFTDISGHFFLQWGTCTGIVLSGTGHTIRNSTIEKTAGNGVQLLGKDHIVFNNTLLDTAYAGTDAAAVNTVSAGTGTDHEIAYNTIRRTGRSGITPRSHGNSDASGGQFKARYHHNDIAYFGIQDWDVGGFYVAFHDGQFVRIDHNLVSEGRGFISAGVYLDYTKNYIVDHNVVWNVEWGIKIHGHSGNENNTLVYNNTSSVRNLSSTPFGPFAIGNSSGNNVGTVLRNNILTVVTPPGAPGYEAIGAGASAFSSAEIASNLAWNGVANSGTDPRWVNAATTLDATGVNYALQSGSAAINAGTPVGAYTRNGVTVPPFPDYTNGAPDAGAYEFGIAPWVAGADTTRCAEPIPSPWPGHSVTPVTVTLRTLTPGATIRYTTDGSTPTANTGTVYTGPFVLSAATTLRSLATTPGLSNSPVAIHSYDIFVAAPLGTPLAFTGTAAAGPVVNLGWTDNASAETSYRVERRLGISGAWTQIASLPANSTSYADSTANPATEYSYRVFAANGGGNGASSVEALLITPGTFTQPGTLNSAQTANTSVVVPVQIRNVASTAQTFMLPPVTGSYTGITSTQPGGPSFAPWTDVSGTGTTIPEFTPTSGNNRDDLLSSTLNIGFPFRFYGTSFSQLKVSTNGFLTFDTASSDTAWGNSRLPSTDNAPRNLIAFYWDDLIFTNAKSSRAYSRSFDSTGGANPDTFVIQFSNVVLYNDQDGPAITIQIILKKDGTIRCNYLSVPANNPRYTIGLNNADGTQGLQLAFNQTLVSSSSAIQIGAGFGITASPSSLLVAAGSTGTAQLTVNSTGLPLGVTSASLTITSDLPRQPAFSLPVNLTVLADNPAAPATPSGFTGSLGIASVLLTWNAAAAETSFKLERSPNGFSSWTQIAWLGQETTSYLDAGLVLGTYYYRLRATNSGGDSAYTSTVAFSLSSLHSFRTTHGLAANGSQDLLTLAGDGVANLLKFAFNMLGTGPGQASTLATPNASVLTANGTAGLPLVGIGTGSDAGKLQLTYIRRKATASPAPGITYAVEFSDALSSWAVNNPTVESVTDLGTTFERVTVTDSVQNPIPAKRFARVKVSSP